MSDWSTIKSEVSHSSGIPLGGIGTGSIEIQPDGYFHEWLIFNLGKWAPSQPSFCQTEGPDMAPGALSFFLRTQQGKHPPMVRRLGTRTDQNDLYSFSWLKNVEAIEFDGTFPLAELKYKDDALPVKVRARMFAPFVPHDTRASGTPGFYSLFRVKNTSKEPVEVSLLSTLRNPIAWGASDRALHNDIAREGDATMLTMQTDTLEAPCKATIGSLSMGLSGGETSWIAGEFNTYLHGRWAWGAYGLHAHCILNDWRDMGKLTSLPANRPPADLLTMSDEEIDAMDAGKKRSTIEYARRYWFADSLWHHVTAVEGEKLDIPEGMGTFLKEVRHILNDTMGDDRKRQDWGVGALSTSVTLAPGEEKELRFTLGWYFPYHFSARGPVMGHMYENWFKDAADVNRYLIRQHDDVGKKTLEFAEALHDTNLPEAAVYAWSSQLSTMSKCTWWPKDGQFGVWEGLGCCGFHTTDITYQGSFNILALFPELQKRQMEMGAKFQRSDGRIPHFFTPDLTQVDNGFDRVDMNQQYVLLVCRDYMWTGDKEFLQRQWPHILRAMNNTNELDADGDGLPDHDTRRNTYDAWNFFGTPSYIASLWLGALVAAARIAEDLGEHEQAAKWKELLTKGSDNFHKKLWNGEYYSLWVDGPTRDECCMTDQVDGEWFTHLIGMGTALPKDLSTKALKAVVKYNFSPEDGLINASYPPGKKPHISTYKNVQACAPWTGIEYAIGSMLIDFGMVEEGLAVCATTYDRYRRAGRMWNHVECGDHYYRAMCGWAILLATTGFKVDVPRQTLTVAPIGKDVHAPWVSSTGWGRFKQKGGSLTLECLGGTIAFRTLRLRHGSGTKVRVNGGDVAADASDADGYAVLRLTAPVELHAGQSLTAG